MKKIINVILVVVVSALLVFGASLAIKAIPSDETPAVSEEFAEAYPSATDVKEIQIDEKTETINKVYEVSDASGLAGYIFDATAPNGFAGEINFLVGISKEGLIQGFRSIEHSETQGYGSKMDEAEFKDGMKDVNISNGISAGQGDKDNGEIVTMSGATVTTDAILGELKAVVNTLATLSDEVNEISEEAPYFAEKYERLLPEEISNYTFEEFEKDGFYDSTVKRIIRVKQNGALNSYILQLQSNGYAGNIDTLVRINDEYRVFDALFARHNETPELGGYIDDDIYRNELKGLNLDKNFLTKSIKIKKQPVGEKDILLISGSTITSQAVQNALNGAIEKLVEFDSLKTNDEYYKELNYEDLLTSSEPEKPSYNHEELFEGFESSEPVEIAENEHVVAVSKAVVSGQEGYIFDVNSQGFAGKIEYGVFVNNDGEVKDLVIYSSNETEGYGSEIESDKYKEQLIGTSLSELDEIKAGEHIQAISGATITTDAMKNSLNSVLEVFKSLGN